MLPPSSESNKADKSRWSDVIAGLSIAGLLLPEAVAYSNIANLPLQTGVIALFAGLICYCLFGSSRFAIVSATSSSAVVLAAASASLAQGDTGLRLSVAIGLVIVSGSFFLVAGLAQLGSISDFIAKPVLRGFSFGLAVVIVIKQCAVIVGIHPARSDLVGFLHGLFTQMDAWNSVGIAIGVVALGLLSLLARLQRLPAGIVVILLGIAAGKWLNLPQYGVGLVGEIQLQLAAPSLPQLSAIEWLRLGELGFAMVMILYAESYSSIRTFAMKHGDIISTNRDLMALGIANLVSGLFHGMPVGAGYSATSANEAAGAVSRFSGLYAAAAAFIVIVTMLPAIELIPQPVLAAIVIYAVSHTLHPAIFRPYFFLRTDRLVVIAGVLGVLILGVLDGLLAAIGISLLMMLRRLANSSISILGRLEQSHDFVNLTLHPTAQAVPGIIILRPEQPLFFANAERIFVQARNIIIATDKTIHTVILSLEESPDLDSSCIEAIRDFHEFITGRGMLLLFARVKDPVQDILNRASIPSLVPTFIIGLSVDDAVEIAQKHRSRE
ncbi:MAG: SulP family inorganic anion transporter [Glaciimonas sp.]|nr:SulP family inorganic anion transporter [Glaciimonas sp.]